ncbi:class C sortase [Actinomycetaceae bacterium MB13-C1-2]|nr:class C sortase [Actinomycetaceae bacterium MB13-C1-2]
MKRRTRQMISGLLIQFAVMVGVGLLVYADAAEWFSAINQRRVMTGYNQSVEQTSDPRREELLDAAYQYNDTLQAGLLLDPFITKEDDGELNTPRYRAYMELLRVSGSDAIGTLTYPDLDIALPIYHGTEQSALSRGIGHLYGTSLPVGGPGTHSVLTAHSGLKNARLLTNLLNAEVGQTLWISVMGEDHYYQVRQIETVEPGDTESLAIIPGEDWVTVFTCTPIGLNTHRLMVHAERIDGPGDIITVPEVPAVGFPWWVVWFVGVSSVSALLLFTPGRKRAERPSNEDMA